MAQFPSSIISFPTRVNGQIIDAADVNSPDAEITAVQSFVGTQSSTFGMTYDLRSPNSNGGGHVQSADKGGTGQTSYTKGDMLVAQGPSVLGKLAAGPDGYVPSYDSTQTSGMKPTAVATEANIRNQAATYALASVLSASVYGITFPNIVSVLQAGQAFQVKWPNTPTSVFAVQVSSLLAQRVLLPDLTTPSEGTFAPSMISILENDGSQFQASSRGKGGTTIYKSGTTTKDAADANGTQTIAHGLGGTPKKVKITMNSQQADLASGRATAISVYNGTTQSSQSTYDYSTTGGGGASAFVTDNNFRINVTTNSPNTWQDGVITFDATNISIAWTRNGLGGVPGGVYQLLWEAET